MKLKHALTPIALAALALTGCASNPVDKNAEKGPDGTIAYLVEVESSEPGARIEANNEYLGKTPLTIKIFGDSDGTFHNFGSQHYTITAYPVRPGQNPQTKDFRTGGWFSEEDRVPKKLFFDFGMAPASTNAVTK